MSSCELNLKATELCLALPGAAAPSINVVELMVEAAPPAAKVTGKRGFSETVDLNLNDLQQEDDDHKVVVKNDGNNSSSAATPPPKHYSSNKPPAPKAQVVGWPPVRSYRKNVMAQKNNMNTTPAAEDVEAAVKGGGIIIKKSSESCSSGGGGAAFVKVCMDGAPYLRKVDLKMYSSYQQLSDSLAKMFSSFTTIGNNNNNGVGEEGMNMIDFMNERKVMDGVNSSEYVPTYEDKDGDWMLVGDVPWEMFVNSCKRLRIMKGSEAIGLAPRAMEKCKSRA